MNRKRCPWCGKRIDKTKDKVKSFWQYLVPGHSLLKRADCSHCRNKYGQAPIKRYYFTILISIILIAALGLIVQSTVLFISCIIPCFFLLFTPYSKLDDKGRPYKYNPDLYCEIEIIEKYGEIKNYEIYFLNNSFDDYEPFTLASPIYVYYTFKKSNTVCGEFLYMDEKNYDYIGQEACDLYDTDMNLTAKIKFITDTDK